jgi:phosphatidylinositol alpha-1,6-mannosyltransferase
MMRTMLVTLDFPPQCGGVAVYWANLCRQLDGGNLTVLAPEGASTFEFDVKQKYLIYRRRLLSAERWLWPKWLPLLYYMWKCVKQAGAEQIIVAHVLPTGTAAYILKKLAGVPYVVSAHGLDIALTRACARKLFLTKLILKNAKAIIANSEFTRHELLKFNGVVPEKVSVVYPCPNSVGTAPEAVALTEFIKKYDLGGKKIILTVARLIERKGHDKVISAMPQILRACPNAIYLIVGHGAERQKLEALAERGGVRKQVFFFPDILDSELPFFYLAADVFVMPSRLLENGDVEGFGIVYLEANAYGKPAIAGLCGGAVEAVEHNVNGLLVDSENANEIAQAIISLLINENRARELGERGRRRVEEKFNWAEQARRLAGLIG